jgi:beta-phosphoglucomutase
MNSIQHIVKELLQVFEVKAAIFDLDGTLIDNNHYHLLAWQEYLRQNNRPLSMEEYRQHFNGRTNRDVIEYIFPGPLTDEEISKRTFEKEAVYRQIYQPYIKPVEGLLDLLTSLDAEKIPMAIATSGIQVNIDFMFEHVPVKQFFPVVLNSSHIQKGKPNPEIYLKTANTLGIEPANCLVFEDAAVGVTAAKAAGMKVVAITTTQSPAELADADLLVKDFTADSFQMPVMKG